MPHKDPEVHRQYQTKWRRDNKEKIKGWTSRNPEKARFYDLHVWDKKFGFKLGTMKSLFDKQQNCELCGLPFDKTGGLRPVPDHNHETGKFRGIIHSNCNVGIGMLGDSPDRCQQAVDYLGRNR